MRDRPPVSDATTDGGSRRRLPFWILQAYELIAALLLVWVSAHLVHGVLLTLAGVALAVACLCADGPLGIVKWCGRRLHVAIVLILVAASLGGLVLASLRPDAEGILLLVLVQAGLAYTALLTRTAAARPAGTTPAPAPATSGSGPPDSGPSTLDRAARSLGAGAGAGKRAAERHRPAAEQAARKTARGAGRLAGRWSGRTSTAPGGPDTSQEGAAP